MPALPANRDWLEFADEEKRRYGRPARWCGECRTWHVRACDDETRRPWWERVDISLMFSTETV